jgi:hypothetical protein
MYQGTDDNYKPFERYQALENIFARLKSDNVVKNPLMHFARALGYKGARPDNQFRDKLDIYNHLKRFNDTEWREITDELYRLDPKYALMFFNDQLSHSYGFNVIDEAMITEPKQSAIGEIFALSRSLTLEASDVMRLDELLNDSEVSQDDKEIYLKEIDELVAVAKSIKERIIGTCKEEE